MSYKKFVGSGNIADRVDPRGRVIEALKKGRTQHEMLKDEITKIDLLKSGQVTAIEVIEFLNPKRGVECRAVPHATLPEIITYEYRSCPKQGGLPVSWYVKCYCLIDERDEKKQETWFVNVFASDNVRRG